MKEEKQQIAIEYKFFTKPLLIEANEAAIREKRNYYIDPNKINDLFKDSHILYISNFYYHKKNELRLIIDTKRKFKILDVTITRYNTLPSIIFYEDGSRKLELKERPYPNQRQWQESEIKRPLRKQSKFRKQILTNYNYTCALCEINDKRLLRAAHILDVKYGGLETEDNGICLCVNHETAFDKGIIIINSDFSISAPKGIGITVNTLKLPKDEIKHPSLEKLKIKKQFLIE